MMNQQPNILIGDDGTPFAAVLASELRCKGFWTYTRPQDAASLREAVKKQPPNVILLNLSRNSADVFRCFAAVLTPQASP